MRTGDSQKDNKLYTVVRVDSAHLFPRARGSPPRDGLEKAAYDASASLGVYRESVTAPCISDLGTT